MVHRIGDVLRQTDLDDLDRLSIILSRTVENDRDRMLATEALSLLAEHRATAMLYLSSSGDLRH